MVTGASSGIGRETAILLSNLGAQVVLLGRDEQRLAETKDNLKMCIRDRCRKSARKYVMILLL